MLWRKKQNYSNPVPNSDVIVAVSSKIYYLLTSISFQNEKNEKENDKEWMWQWSSRPDQLPPKYVQLIICRMLHVLFIALHVAQTRTELSLIDFTDVTCDNWLLDKKIFIKVHFTRPQRLEIWASWAWTLNCRVASSSERWTIVLYAFGSCGTTIIVFQGSSLLVGHNKRFVYSSWRWHRVSWH